MSGAEVRCQRSGIRKLPPLQGEGWGGDGVAPPRRATPRYDLWRHCERSEAIQSVSREDAKTGRRGDAENVPLSPSFPRGLPPQAGEGASNPRPPSAATPANPRRLHRHPLWKGGKSGASLLRASASSRETDTSRFAALTTTYTLFRGDDGFFFAFFAASREATPSRFPPRFARG